MAAKKHLFVLLAAACCVQALALAPDEKRQQVQEELLLTQFQSWVVEHNKPYLHDRKEFVRRFKIWSQNVAHISQANQQRAAAATNSPGSSSRSSVKLGLTAHTDLTSTEFAAKYLGAPMASRAFTHLQEATTAPAETATSPDSAATSTVSGSQESSVWAPLLRRLGLFGSKALHNSHEMFAGAGQSLQHWRYENVTPPTAADWRGHEPPVLGPIKDQHVNSTPCGSCWAFSAVSIMEIASAMATGKVVSGSEQQLIDCDRKYDHGCAGGGWLNAIQYAIKNKGLVEEEAYPYTGVDGACNKELEKQDHELQVDSWEDVPFSNETAMMAAVSQTPIITAICVGPALDDWHHYTGGIFDLPCCEKEEEVTLDHGIVVVGYGEEGGVPYWVLKNSWGATWGEKGFMRIRRMHGKDGKCALAKYPAMVFRKLLP